MSKATYLSWPPEFTVSGSFDFKSGFPNFLPQHCDFTRRSLATDSYNCIAWAASDDTRRWWPDPFFQDYWPPSVPRERTIAAFISAFETLEYAKCKNGRLERRFEKIAIYVDQDNKPTHAARQSQDGSWTSKFGNGEDVTHYTLDCLDGPGYGKVHTYMKRRRRT